MTFIIYYSLEILLALKVDGGRERKMRGRGVREGRTERTNERERERKGEVWNNYSPPPVFFGERPNRKLVTVAQYLLPTPAQIQQHTCTSIHSDGGPATRVHKVPVTRNGAST